MNRSLRIQSNSAQDTQELGRIIGRYAQPGDVYLLTGPLGSGKTCLAQGIGRGLCVQEDLRSPTFVLMTRRQGRLTLHHLDLYRIDNPWEVWDLGVDEQLFGEGDCVVEWADRVPELFTGDHLSVHMERRSDTTRRLTISSSGPDYREVLSALRAALTGH